MTHAFEQVHQILRGDVARRIRRERASADPTERCVEHRDAGLHRCGRVREAHVARVVEVAAEPDIRAEHVSSEGHAGGHVGRHGDPDRVGERDLAGPERSEFAQDPLEPIDPDLALVRAAERGGERDRRGDSGLGGARTHVGRGGDQARRIGTLVALGEGVGADDHSVDLVDPAGDRSVEAAPVEDQPDVGRPERPRCVVGMQRRHHRVGIGHLRHPSRVHEAHRLDSADARAHEPRDQLDLLLGRQHRRVGLQPVTGGHVHDFDVRAHRAILADR
jgi:hypothetical protein